MHQERTPAENFFIALVEYFKRGPEAGVNNFVLSGPIDVPINFKTIIGVFPILAEESERNYLIVTTENREPSSHYSEILGLELPRRIRELTIDNRRIRRTMERWAVIQGMPSVAIGICETIETKEKVISLFAVWGISPEKALEEIQEATRQRLAGLS